MAKDVLNNRKLDKYSEDVLTHVLNKDPSKKNNRLSNKTLNRITVVGLYSIFEMAIVTAGSNTGGMPVFLNSSPTLNFVVNILIRFIVFYLISKLIVSDKLIDKIVRKVF
jgi:hypothetical protein